MVCEQYVKRMHQQLAHVLPAVSLSSRTRLPTHPATPSWRRVVRWPSGALLRTPWPLICKSHAKSRFHRKRLPSAPFRPKPGITTDPRAIAEQPAFISSSARTSRISVVRPIPNHRITAADLPNISFGGLVLLICVSERGAEVHCHSAMVSAMEVSTAAGRALPRHRAAPASHVVRASATRRWAAMRPTGAPPSAGCVNPPRRSWSSGSSLPHRCGGRTRSDRSRQSCWWSGARSRPYTSWSRNLE